MRPGATGPLTVSVLLEAVAVVLLDIVVDGVGRRIERVGNIGTVGDIGYRLLEGGRDDSIGRRFRSKRALLCREIEEDGKRPPFL